MTDIRDTLKARTETCGDYSDHSRITQMFKAIMTTGPKWPELDDHEKESLEMIAHKIGRILSGNPHFHDHWLDIAGYAQLSADRNVTIAPLTKSQAESLFQNGLIAMRAPASAEQVEPLPKRAG